MTEIARRFRKNQEHEGFLARLNDDLAPIHDAELDPSPPPIPTIHVIGVPRSGTTLMTQLISAHLAVGYIDRLAAAFWRAPIYGIRLSRALHGDGLLSSYTSDFGSTGGFHEPHEFGYFWRDLLGHVELAEIEADPTNVDWERVTNRLRNIAAEFGAPVVFKPFMFGWMLAAAQQALPEAVFVWMRRNPVETAMSLLRLRDAMHGNRSRWASLRPREYEALRDLPPADQVAGQVFYVDRAIERQVSSLGGRHVVEVEYSTLCADPAAVLSRIRKTMKRAGTDLATTSEPPGEFSPGGAHDADDPAYDAVVGAVDRLFAAG